MEGDKHIGFREELALGILPGDEPAGNAIPGRPRPPVRETDDEHGVVLHSTPGDGVAGVHVLLGDLDPSLCLDGPDTNLQVVLVPLLTRDWVLDLLGVQETGLVGQVWTRDDQVSLEPPLTSFVAITLKGGHL